MSQEHISRHSLTSVLRSNMYGVNKVQDDINEYLSSKDLYWDEYNGWLKSSLSENKMKKIAYHIYYTDGMLSIQYNNSIYWKTIYMAWCNSFVEFIKILKKLDIKL